VAKNNSLVKVISTWIGEAFDKIVLFMVARGFGWMLALMLSFPHRKRMSHNNGIGATGWLQIVDDPEFPEHDFFTPGRVFPARIRHASISFLDDAMNCFRSISIKFSDHHFRSPFDLELNTGERSAFWSAASFFKFGSLGKEKWGVSEVEFLRKYPDGEYGIIKALRRNPTSFYNMQYYSKTPFYFIGKDGIKRYAKYRVVPANGEPETGIIDDPSIEDLANQRILPFETRGRNYLKYEYEDRVKKEELVYLLSIQLRTASDDDEPEIFNNMIPWNSDIYPWQDLALIHIDKTLDWRESTRTTFSVNNMPRSLGVLPAKSIYDYNSLNYMRAHSEIARKARMFSYKVWGMVPPIPDNDNRNVDEWGV
jgi:arachidonate 5-lipoxygenase